MTRPNNMPNNMLHLALCGPWSTIELGVVFIANEGGGENAHRLACFKGHLGILHFSGPDDYHLGKLLGYY